MMIQMAFIKKEIMVAMDAIERILKETDFTMAFMPMAVAALMGVTGLYSLRLLVVRMFTLRTEKRAIVRRIRFTLRDIQRLLLSCTIEGTDGSLDTLSNLNLGRKCAVYSHHPVLRRSSSALSPSVLIPRLVALISPAFKPTAGGKCCN